MAGKLTNKFTKSVLEREQKELQERKGTSPIPIAPETGGANPHPQTVGAQFFAAPAVIEAPKATEIAPPAIETPRATESAPPAVEAPEAPAVAPRQAEARKNTSKTPAQKVTSSLDGFLTMPQNRIAKNKTFYLDAAVIEALKSAAAAHQVAESKLVNDILKKVLDV